MRIPRPLELCVALALVFATAHPASLVLADQPSGISLEELNGQWEGTWQHRSDFGEIRVTFHGNDVVKYLVVDNDRMRTQYQWDADVIRADEKLIIKARGFDRVETYELRLDQDGNDVLEGSYTFNGKQWGTISLSRAGP